jgi:concanavalin A-like lectin/glucanase superfamily protein
MPTCTRRSLLGRVGFAALSALGAGAYAAAMRYRERILAKHPVAYWPLDEAAGPLAHALGDGAHLGEYRGAVAFGQPGPIRSEWAGAIGLNGIDAYVEVPDSSAFSQASSGEGLSVEAWMRPDQLLFPGQTAEHYVHWLGKGRAGEFEWGFRFYSKNSSRPNRISAYIWNSTSQPGVSNEGAGAYFEDPLQPGAWIHVVACFDPGNANRPFAGVSIYKNGVLRHGPSSSQGARYSAYDIRPRHGSAPLRFGTRDQRSFLTGGLGAVAIYPRVLSAREIRDNFLGA